MRFLAERIVFRGGIYYGDAFVDPNRNMLFGPAVNCAYKLESAVAVHPRIIIDQFVAKTVIENIMQIKLRVASETPEYVSHIGMGLMPSVPKMPGTGDGIVEKDIDGQYIFNYLHFPENNIVLSDCYLSCQDFLEELIHYCHMQIDTINEYKIIDKYYYLLRFLRAKFDNLLGTTSQR